MILNVNCVNRLFDMAIDKNRKLALMGNGLHVKKAQGEKRREELKTREHINAMRVLDKRYL